MDKNFSLDENTNAIIVNGVGSIDEFIKIIKIFDTTPEFKGRNPLYRGQVKDWELLPKIMRIVNKDINLIELKLLRDFKNYSKPYLNHPHSNEIEILYHAQHYGLPTRLLDFTSNPLVALWFAFYEKADVDVRIVWALSSVDMFNLEDSKLPEYSIELHEPDELYVFEPPKINERIINQGSFFMSFDIMNRIPLEKRKEIPKFKFIIDNKLRAEFLKMLDRMGINEKSIYPGLEGVCRYIENSLIANLDNEEVSPWPVPRP